MRLDKFLKTARIIKKRSDAKEIVLQQRVLVNDRIVKPSENLKENDIVVVQFGNRILSVRVLMLLKQASKEDASKMFEIIDDKYIGID